MGPQRRYLDLYIAVFHKEFILEAATEQLHLLLLNVAFR
jgi:hypothetical protein